MQPVNRITFGPVPSRRLGRSLGINNITPKNCSYSCVYCQLGGTIDVQVGRKSFLTFSELVSDVLERIKEAEQCGAGIDYLTFVPDGEPTLDANLGKEISLLRESGIRIAVITNASLIWREDVRSDLMEADWVSLKVDSVTESVWRRINRPEPSLNLDRILKGAVLFSERFPGILTTETMLVSGLNDSREELERIGPSVSHISIPTSPPSEEWAVPPDESVLADAYNIFKEHLSKVELLVGFEGTDFTITGDPVGDILAIASVHPIRKDAMEVILERTGLSWETVEILKGRDELKEVEYKGFLYYMKKFR